jgi:hypothetical protein
VRPARWHPYRAGLWICAQRCRSALRSRSPIRSSYRHSSAELAASASASFSRPPGRAEHELGLVEPERRRMRLLARQRGQPLPQPAQRPRLSTISRPSSTRGPRSSATSTRQLSSATEPSRPSIARSPTVSHGRRVLDQRRLGGGSTR